MDINQLIHDKENCYNLKCNKCSYHLRSTDKDYWCKDMLDQDTIKKLKSIQMHWNELKTTIEEMKDNAEPEEVRRSCSFLLNLMNIQEEHIRNKVHHGKLGERRNKGLQKEHSRLLIVVATQTRRKSSYAPRRRYRNRAEMSTVCVQKLHAGRGRKTVSPAV